MKGGSQHPRKLRPALIEMILANLFASKKFRIHKLTPSCRKNILRNFTCIRTLKKGRGRRQRQIVELDHNIMFSDFMALGAKISFSPQLFKKILLLLTNNHPNVRPTCFIYTILCRGLHPKKICRMGRGCPLLTP